MAVRDADGDPGGTAVALVAGMQPFKFLATAAFFCVSALVCLSNSRLLAEDEATIRVLVEGGRTFAGQVDATTNQEDLVLRSGSDRAWVRRTIGWERIVSGEHAGKSLTTAELRAVADSIKSWPSVILDPTDHLASAREPALLAEPIAAPPVISSITFDAALANWDGDVEADGLIVHLQPIDLYGFYAATSGTVEIELFARQRRAFHHVPQAGGKTIELISRWTCALTPADFGPSGAVLKFPFGTAHPEFSGELGSYGLVHVRMSVPGSGAFEDSQDGVRIRPFTPLRDTLQLNTGQRFMPTERTGRGKGSYDGGR